MNLYVISGVTGMTGNELSRQLLKKGEKVIGFDNFFASSLHSVRDLLDNPSFRFHEWDINNRAQMEELLSLVTRERFGCEKIIYINCAAVVHTEYFYDVNATFTTNVLGMKAFLDQAIEIKADIFINCSTSEVYSMESWKDGGMKESDYITMATAEHSQRTSYATGKLLTEFFMKDAVDRGLIKGCSARFANVYSPDELYPKHIIPHIINSLRNTGTVELLENSRVNRRTFLHNIDSCGAVLALINNPDALDGTAYNVATEEEISIVDLVSLCATKLGLEAGEDRIIFNGWRESDPQRRVLSTEKLRSRTGWEPSVSLADGIEMCVKRGVVTKE